MTIHNSVWISVSPTKGGGYSFIRLIDIDKVTITPGDGEKFIIQVRSLGETYTYDTVIGTTKADESAYEILRLVDEARGIPSQS